MASSNARPIFEDVLLCSVCYQQFERPKLLPCLHTFCNICLTRHHEIEQRYRHTTVSNECNMRSQVSCPSCRTLATVPCGQVSQFQDDFSVEKVVHFIEVCYGKDFLSRLLESPEDQEEVTATEEMDSLAGQSREEFRRMVTKTQCTLVKLRSKIMEIVLLFDGVENLKVNDLRRINEVDPKNPMTPEEVYTLRKSVEDHYRPAMARLQIHLDRLYSVAIEYKFAYVLLEELIEKGQASHIRKAEHKLRDLVMGLNVNPSLIDVDVESELKLMDIGLEDFMFKDADARSLALSDTLSLRSHTQDADNRTLLCRLSRAGVKPGQFHYPTHATFLPSGGFMVSDKNNRRIQIFDSSGRFKRLFANNCVKPRRARVNPKDGLVYVSDEQSGSVQVFKFENEARVRSIGDGFFQCPAGMDFDSKGNLVMTDADKATVSVYNLEENKMNKFAYAYFEPNVPCPYFAATNSKDDIIASDFRNNNVRVFNSKGRQLFHIPNLCCPRGVCVDSSDNILVAEGDAHRVSLYSPYGKFLQHVLTKKDGLQYPMSVDIDKNQRILVTQFGPGYSEVIMFQLSYDMH